MEKLYSNGEEDSQMLIEFGVENLLSYKDRQIFKMDSDFRRAKIFNDNVLYKIPVDKKNRYVLNTAAVYGSNAGGKTNLIASMRYLHEIVKSSNDLNSIAPFQFTNERKPISFHIKFLKRYNEDNYLFKYVLDIFDGKVLKEQLSYQLVRKTTLSDIQIIFKRENDQIHEYAPGLEELVKDMNKHNNETRAILTVLYQDINKTHYQNIVDTLAYQLLKVAYEFISYDLAFGRESVDESYLVKKLQEYPELKEKLIDALYDIDITISDLEFEDVTDLLIDDIMNDTQLPKDLKKRFIETRKSNRVYNIKTIRELEDSNFDLEFGSESLGTIKFIFDFIQLMDCIENNRVYIIDEIENHYHPLIQRYILQLFLQQGKGHTSQLIFTTHNTDFLESKLFAKEQIWLIDKDRHSLASEVYRLSDFDEVTYENHNWRNIYREGRIGAIPKVIY